MIFSLKVPSTSTNSQQIATVSHLVALANQTRNETLSKTQQQQQEQQQITQATTIASTAITTTSKTKTSLTQPIQVKENPLEHPLETAETTTTTTTTPTCLGHVTTNEIPAITASATAINNNNNNNNNHHHHLQNQPAHLETTLEVLADPQLQQQLEQVQQQNCEILTNGNTSSTPALTSTTTMTTATSIMHKTQGASTSNATTITSISALSPQTPTVTTPSSNAPLPHAASHLHQQQQQQHHPTNNSPSAYPSSQVTPISRPKNAQQQPLSSIANPMHKVTKRKETLEAKRERKAAKTLAIITGAFVVCWLPFFAMALILPLCESCEINDGVASFFLWLGYFNSTLNPVIYTIFSPEFRQAFKRILFGGHRPVHYRSGKL
ncbi:hypothetical protein DOY81_012856 [Sarcophaga bullata]|nr:hypothetical protein DOY81_012856 [Sarcophaga bullata]